MERVKDIQFSSKQRFNTQKVRELQEMRAALGRLLAKRPPDLAAEPEVRELATLRDDRDWTIAHINNRHPQQGGQYKDVEFSRAAARLVRPPRQQVEPVPQHRPRGRHLTRAMPREWHSDPVSPTAGCRRDAVGSCWGYNDTRQIPSPELPGGDPMRGRTVCPADSFSRPDPPSG
jgi:hypothetical protein